MAVLCGTEIVYSGPAVLCCCYGVSSTEIASGDGRELQGQADGDQTVLILPPFVTFRGFLCLFRISMRGAYLIFDVDGSYITMHIGMAA